MTTLPQKKRGSLQKIKTEPRDTLASDPREWFADFWVQRGFPKEDAELIATAQVDPEFRQRKSAKDYPEFAHEAAMGGQVADWRKHFRDNREYCLANLLLFWSGHGNRIPTWMPERPCTPNWGKPFPKWFLTLCSGLRLNWADLWRSVKEWDKANFPFRAEPFGRIVAEFVDPGQVLDPARKTLRALHENHRDFMSNHCCLAFWLRLVLPENDGTPAKKQFAQASLAITSWFAWFGRWFSHLSFEEQAAWLLELCWSTENLIILHWENRQIFGFLAQEIGALAQAVIHALSATGKKASDLLVFGACVAVTRTWGTEYGHLGKLPKGLLDTTVEAAKAWLGRARAQLRQQPNECDLEYLLKLREAWTTLQFARPWVLLKNLLQLLRFAPEPVVTRDLRYWPELEETEQPNSQWTCIIRAIAHTLHPHQLRKELEMDPKLGELRAAFAEYCIERLKPRENGVAHGQIRDAMLTEPEPAWRYAYLRAFSELFSNPRGTGHRVVHQVSQFDPDPQIREEAEKLLPRLRRAPTLPDGRTPRRALVRAFWWLRAGHYLSFHPNEGIDESGAQRTLDREMHRDEAPY